MKVKTVLGVVAIIAVTAVSTGAVYTHIMNTAENKYESQIAKLQTTLDDIGPMVDCYTVNQKSEPGQPILQTELVPIRIPKSVMSDSYILDPSSIVGKYYKVSVSPQTPITADLIMDEAIDSTQRDVDITPQYWPIGLKVGDYVDLRLQYPKGENYTVLSHKRVMGINGEAIKVYLSEKEQMFYAASAVDYYMNSKVGAAFYLTKYVEPGVQQASTVYYNIPNNVLAIIQANPNIVDKVISNGISRAVIDAGAKIDNEAGSSINAGQVAAIGKLTTARQAYDELQVELQEQQKMDEEDSDSSAVFTTNPGGGGTTASTSSTVTVIDDTSQGGTTD